MPSIGPLELIVVLVIALVVLGPKRLPDAGRSLGEGLRGFRDSMSGKGDDTPALAEPALVTADPVAAERERAAA